MPAAGCVANLFWGSRENAIGDGGAGGITTGTTPPPLLGGFYGVSEQATRSRTGEMLPQTTLCAALSSRKDHPLGRGAIGVRLLKNLLPRGNEMLVTAPPLGL